MIPYGRQDITQQDIDAVVDVLRSDFLTQGPAVPRFEQAVATYCKVKKAIAVNSATSALHLACIALGLKTGGLLWTSPITFVASANCARYCGADVDFVDIDPVTYNLCPAALEEKLVRAAKENRLPDIVVPVHFGGHSCDMQAIQSLADRFGFKIIEDASHAIGGCYKGEPVGSCQYSDVTVFSFHPVKIVTSAEGGMATTNDDELAKRIELLRSHGVTRDPQAMTEEPHGPWYYQQVGLGYNYRMTDIQAALGCSQLSRIDDYVARRHAIADRYNDLLQSLSVTLPTTDQDTYSAWHLFVVRVEPEKRTSVFVSMREQGIGVNVHYIPVHTQPYYRKLGFSPGQFPNSEAYYREAISLPMFPVMSVEQQDEVVRALQAAFAR